ncbi:30S ribosomal protein S16 [Patescibacteria group bacterium]
MVKIRLFRTGARNQPSYRVVAIDSRNKRDGKVLEILGFYNPRSKPETVEIKMDRVKHWLDHGAQPTKIVKKLIDQLTS